jgi:hypothetical protein
MSDRPNVMTVDSSLGPQSTNRPTDLLRIDGQLTFICALMDDRSREVTKRMAACWNACDQIQDPENVIPQLLKANELILELEPLRIQCDELLEALILCKIELEYWMPDHGQDIAAQKAISKATLAIAKATGEAE